MIYRIYTEDLGNLGRLAAKYFLGFTVIPARGYWQGNEEQSTVIEVLTTEKDKVFALAREIKETNKQETVLVTVTATTETFV